MDEREGVRLFGKSFTGRDLLRRVGRLEQVGGVEPFVFGDGPARGTRALRVRTGVLSFDVLPDRGMGIGAAEYRGVPLAWISANGPVAPSLAEHEGEGFLRAFGGGLLATCGLQNVGEPSEKDGEPLGLHGRISATPASSVSHETHWDEKGCLIRVRGELRESKVFGANLVLRRTISTRLGEARIRLEDTVTNEGFDPQPLMLLYHVNLGWPLLSETARLTGPGRTGEPPEPRDEDARAGLEAWDRFAPPTPGFAERVFYHRPVPGGDGWAGATLENREIGLRFGVRFRPAELPEFVQWTMTGEGVYVLGLEPATCRVGGYEKEAAEGRVILLQPGEIRRFRLDLEVSET